MKKIFIFLLSFFCFFSVFAEATLDDLLDELEAITQEQSTITGILTGNFLPNTEDGATQNIYDLLWYALDSYNVYPSIQETIANFDSTFQDFCDFQYPEYFSQLLQKLDDRFTYVDDWISSIFYHLSDNWQDISNGFAQNHADLVNVRQAIHDLEMSQEGYLSGANGYLEQIGYGLTDIIEILQNQYGSSSSDLPQVEIGYYPLNHFGKDVDIKNLSLSSFETTGEYNKDVHRLLIGLNQIGSSQNNAALSILTNVQVIATLLSEDAKGKEKVEKDLEDREYQSTKAESELSNITSESWDSAFTPPRSVSEVYGNLSISVSDPTLPNKITVIDRFYYETAYFNAEFDELSFEIPQGLIELANYARIVFGFVYWSLTLGLAIFIFRLWMKLYTVVTQNFVNS